MLEIRASVFLSRHIMRGIVGKHAGIMLIERPTGKELHQASFKRKETSVTLQLNLNQSNNSLALAIP
jgi:hypothetical protein